VPGIGARTSIISTVSKERASPIGRHRSKRTFSEGRDIVLVGGGNSAGQAAVFLALYARRIHLVVRSAGLEASMSRYLIDRITATPNIELRVHSAVIGLSGTPSGDLESVLVSCQETGGSWQVDAQHMFLFIGADPNTHGSIAASRWITKVSS
jgi:thioredoxin reductase